MPGIYLHSSNRLEILADRFAELVGSSPLPPFKQETVLVQSRGMARWLAMETASRLKIWANCTCPFPNTFINSIYRLLLAEDLPDAAIFSKEYSLWHIMTLLADAVQDEQLARVSEYLKSGDEMKLFQLARETADLFDQYTLYRPGMILDWESGAENIPDEEFSWQARLWLRFMERISKFQPQAVNHRARLLHLFLEKISDSAFNAEILPERISVFGISSLPPYHLRVLSALAYHSEVHFFLMNPCLEYWFDIVADRSMVKISRREQSDQRELHLHEGNSLLASMGHAGRDFLAMLQEFQVTEEEHYDTDNFADTLLSHIQQDILFLRQDRNTFHNTLTQEESVPINSEDSSITFHSCHSAMREVEVLHDLLLDMFNDPNRMNRPEPREILVMAPDIEEYAPLIRAVFAAVNEPHKKIPYAISDQSIRRTSKFIETFFDILKLSTSRFTGVEVMAILETEAVRNRFSLTETDLTLIETWLREANIRWGIDSQHKKQLGLPSYPENTWGGGLDRLLLGYAMPGNDQKLFKGILPFDPIEGDSTRVLSGLLDFSRTLFDLARKLQQQHNLSDWSEILLQVKNRLLLADENTDAEERILHQMLYGLQELQEKTHYPDKVGLPVIRSYLISVLEERFAPSAGAAGFLTGGVTFCSMLPMRTIPFQVICLLGLNDGRYPRTGRQRSFDLMALKPARGDRSKRYDDRYLFLETLLSARKRLVISYVGQSIQDGSPFPPSVLVSELMDYIDRNFTLPDSCKAFHDSLSRMLTTVHHLQPFHPSYFQPEGSSYRDRLFSYSRENCEAAEALISPRPLIEPEFSEIAQPPPDEFRQVDLQDLIRFYSHPCRYFLIKRATIAPIEESQTLETTEPFTLEGLSRYKLANDILEFLLQNKDCEELYRIRKAAGELPHGSMGWNYFSQLVSELSIFQRTLSKRFDYQEARRQHLDLAVKEFGLSGFLDNFSPNGLVQYRYAKLTAKDVLRSWICHLTLNCLKEEKKAETTGVTYFVCKSGIYRYDPIPDSSARLEYLLQQYWQGLTRPLAFFPATSYIFAKEINRGKGTEEALHPARMEWEGDGFHRKGEKNDPYTRFCFRNISLENTGFMEQAKKILLPALENSSKIRL